MPVNPIGALLRNRRAGQHTLAWARPDLAAPEAFSLTSSAFTHGTAIPDRYRGHLRTPNISPALAWTPPPQRTRELVLIVQDPDAPMRHPATHALAAGIDAALSGIPEDGLRHPSPIPGIAHGRGGFGRLGYSGPLPPRSHGPHTYAFQLYALDGPTGLADAFTLAQLLDALTGHVIARARLDGTYEIR